MSKNLLRIGLIAWLAAMTGPDTIQARQTNTAGPGSVRLPLLGFVYDTAKGLRPIIGIPGSASIGGVLDLGFSVSGASMSPSRDYVLLSTSEQSWPRLLQLRGDAMTVQSLASLVNSQQRSHRVPAGLRIDRMAISPSGSAAAFFSQSQRRIYAFTNLSRTPALTGTFDIGGTDAVSAFAIADDGKTVAVGTFNGDSGSLSLLAVNSPSRLIASMQHPSAVAFLHGSDNLIVADDRENHVYLVAGGQTVAASAENGISSPIAVAVANDNQRIFVANSSSGSITTINLAGTVSEPLYCNCTLSGLHATNAESVFQLTDFSGGPILLLDARKAAPRLMFVRNGS